MSFANSFSFYLNTLPLKQHRILPEHLFSVIALQNDGVPLLDKEGQLLTTTEDQLERWKEYYTEMLTEDSVDEDSQMEEEHAIEDSLEIDVSKPTKLEVENAVRHMRSNKAAGVDEIPSELWKADIRSTTDILAPLLEDIWESGQIPTEENQI
ncbi:hypothetical protein QE152_g24324 [Popillia japonica]|uniref:Uncharacterized protein n=1 Tax=Popillia japonica TaxID=7064 RepID=A0AAW1KFV6_POPJA